MQKFRHKRKEESPELLLWSYLRAASVPLFFGMTGRMQEYNRTHHRAVTCAKRAIRKGQIRGCFCTVGVCSLALMRKCVISCPGTFSMCFGKKEGEQIS